MAPRYSTVWFLWYRRDLVTLSCGIKVQHGLVSMVQERSSYFILWYQGTARSGFYGIREIQLLYRVVPRYSMIWFLLYKRDLVTVSCGIIACHVDVLGGSSHVPAPRTSADLSGKKPRPITADFQIWEVHFEP